MAQASQSIDIDAPAATVMSVITDYETYPDWAGVQSAEVLERDDQQRATSVRFSFDAKLVKGYYVLSYRYDSPSLLSWSLIDSDVLKSNDGSYQLTNQGARTIVNYSLSLEPTISLPGILRRQAEKTILGTALKGLKKRAEAR